jgi:electron transfer flavoprotein beta subunit
VGPQVAEKLGLPQITYAEEVLSADKSKIVVKRRLERGVETVEAPLPAVITVNSSAPACRPRNAKLVMKFKHAKTITERQNQAEDYIDLTADRPYLNIKEWSVNDIDADTDWLGLSGSPTKVKKIENVVFQAKESKVLSPSDEEMNELMKELIANHTIG